MASSAPLQLGPSLALAPPLVVLVIAVE